jgi:proteasome regulatory subunit
VIDIPLPNEVGRVAMFKINLKGISLGEDVDFEKLAKMTEGYSGADISTVTKFFLALM